jgi:hydrogenase maturation protease
MDDQHNGLLILGVGNILLRDDAVGVHVVRAIDDDPASVLPPGTRIVDGGTLGLELLPLVGEAGVLVLVDAVDMGLAPGTVTVLQDAEIERPLGSHVSSHQVGVIDLLAAARLCGTLPQRVVLVGIQAESFEIGLGLSEAVGDAVARATQAVYAAVGGKAAGARHA